GGSRRWSDRPGSRWAWERAKLTPGFEVEQVRQAVVAFLLCGAAACSSAPRPGTGPRPDPGEGAPTLFDAGSVYGSLGLLVGGPALPFIANLRYFADAAPDSTLAMFALSLANHALTFQRDGSGFAAQYHVDVAFRADSGVTRQFATDETVRVRTLQETVRADESVIYQQFIAVRPGIYHIDVTVRDRNAPAVAHGQRADTVPRLAGQGMSEPLAVYQGPGRTRLADVPKLLANPRGALHALSRQLLGPMGHHELRPDDQPAALLRAAGMGGQTASGAARGAPRGVARVLSGDRPGRGDAGERGAGGVFPPGPVRQPAVSR